MNYETDPEPGYRERMPWGLTLDEQDCLTFKNSAIIVLGLNEVSGPGRLYAHLASQARSENSER